MIQTKIFLLLIGFLIVPGIAENVFAENMPVQIEITYPNGDRASLSGSKLIITSQDGKINQELLGKSSEPYFTTELSVDKRYEMLVFVNDMFAGTKYLTLDDNTNPLIKIPINPSVGMKFSVYFEDGATPIRNALLELYSHEGNLIKSIQTGADGKTLRLWVASTVAEEDYYRAKVSISDNLVYESTDIRLNSGSNDFDIVTNWPKIVDFIKIHTNLKQYDYYSSDKNYVAKVYDDTLEKSAFIVRETAHIPKLAVGEFKVLIFEENTPTKILANQTILIDDNYGEYSIPILESTQESDALNHTNSDDVDSNSLDFFNNFENLNWIKQSVSGNQTKSTDSDIFLQLETEGNGNAVFTRSAFNKTDLNDKDIQISYVADDPLSLEQLWIYFSHDDFESWYTFKIPLSDVLQGKLTTTIFDISESDITGEPDPSLINQVQIRIKDKASVPVKLQFVDFYVLDSNKTNTISSDDTHHNLPSCNCVAFRLDDIQDFFLTGIQMEIVETFQKNDVDLTVGVIANNIGRDNEMTEFVSEIADNPKIEFANHGWDHEDFSQFGSVGQEMLLLRSNDKLTEMFGVSPTVFIPPLNAYNSDTISALHAQGFTHFSSELDFATPPFPLSDQTLYHFPETAYTGVLNEQRTKFEGVSADFTFNQIRDSLSEHGFAVVTLHPQEFAQYYNNQYQDKVNYQQIEQLELLFTKIVENDIDIVMISEINTEPNTKQLVPQWVKNNAEWWIDERVSTEEFVNSLEFLIDQKIIIVSDTESTSKLADIPDWVKTNIQWWTEGQTSDSEFISAAEFLIRNGIIQI